MTKITIVPPKLAPLTDFAYQSVEEIMENLCQFGKPRLCRHDTGWMCACDMHVAAAGTTFNVRSEFECKTQLEAARQCAERVVKTLTQWS